MPAVVGGPASLFAEARHEDPGVGHGGAESFELAGPSGADNRPDGPVAGVNRMDGVWSRSCSGRTGGGCGGAGGELFDASGNMFVEGGALGVEFLKVLAAGV